MPTFEFHDMPICGDDGLVDDTIMVDVEVDLKLAEPAEPEWPAVFDIEEVRLTFVDERPLLGREITTLKLTEVEFSTFFAPAADIINNAHEWASEQEIE